VRAMPLAAHERELDPVAQNLNEALRRLAL
jgi:hypothetical protein